MKETLLGEHGSASQGKASPPPILHVRMEDKPGQALNTSQKLAKADLNIEFWLPVDTSKDNFIVAVGVDNVEAGRKALSDQLTTFSYA